VRSCHNRIGEPLQALASVREEELRLRELHLQDNRRAVDGRHDVDTRIQQRVVADSR
jgi:hypothetical protein